MDEREFAGAGTVQPRGVELDGVEFALQVPLAQGELELQVQVPKIMGGLGGPGDPGGQGITAAPIVASAALQQGPGRQRCGHGSRCRRSRPRRRASACPASLAC